MVENPRETSSSSPDDRYGDEMSQDRRESSVNVHQRHTSREKLFSHHYSLRRAHRSSSGASRAHERRLSRRSFLVAGMGAGVALGLAACSSSSGDGENAEAESSQKSSDKSAGTHDTSKIIALNTGQIDGLLALGITPVGMGVANAQASSSESIPQYIKDKFGDKYDLDSITIVGQRTQPDLEKIAALHPTLILANDRTSKDVLDQLKSIAPVVTGKGGAENWKDDFRTIADAVGKRDDAQRLIDDHEDAVAEWKKDRGTSPTVSLIRNKGTDYLMLGPLSLAGQVLKDGGCNRPTSQRFEDKVSHPISSENLDQRDADYLFYGFNAKGDKLTKDALWTNLDVVKNNHATGVDPDPWFLNASVVAANYILEELKKTMK